MNTAAIRNAQWAYDTAEEDWSDHYRDQAIESMASAHMRSPDIIEDCFRDGFVVSTELARMLAAWDKNPETACTVEIVRALSDALYAKCVALAKEDV